MRLGIMGHSTVNHPLETCQMMVNHNWDTNSLVSYMVTELSSSISAQAYIILPNFFVFCHGIQFVWFHLMSFFSKEIQIAMEN
jgi:hypothetical protein